MNLYVVRHGETDFNIQGRYTGSTDIPLNSRGIIQAEQLSQKLLSKHFDIIVTSPLLRARQTADIISTTCNVPALIFDQFAERNVGVYEGLTREEAKERYPVLWDRECTRHLDDAPTGGETIRQFDQRITSGLRHLQNEYPKSSVLLICHAFVSKAINRYINNLSYDEMHSFSLNNCDISEFML